MNTRITQSPLGVFEYPDEANSHTTPFSMIAKRCSLANSYWSGKGKPNCLYISSNHLVFFMEYPFFCAC